MLFFHDSGLSYLKSWHDKLKIQNIYKPLTSSCCCCHSVGCFFCTKNCTPTCKMNPIQLMIAKTRNVSAPPMDWNRTPPSRLPKEIPVQ